MAGGRIGVWLSLYGSKDPAQIDVLARIRDLSLRQAMPATDGVEEMDGIIDGGIRLSGDGNSLRAMLASAEGSVYIVMPGGQVSGLIVELIGLDVAEALGLVLDDDAPVPVRCLVVDLGVEQGVAQARTFVLDTTDTLIEGEGALDLGSERIDFTLTPQPKDISFLSLRSQIQIEGAWSDLSVSPDLGSMLAFLPPIDLGTAEDAPCGQLVAQARQDKD